jgi:hypothetical protein
MIACELVAYTLPRTALQYHWVPSDTDSHLYCPSYEQSGNAQLYLASVTLYPVLMPLFPVSTPVLLLSQPQSYLTFCKRVSFND